VAAIVVVRKDCYYDSVLLMRISQDLKGTGGIEEAVAVMGTLANRDLLRQRGYGGPDLESAGPNDLVVAVRGEGTGVQALESVLEKHLRRGTMEAPQEAPPLSMTAAVQAHPETNLILISVPGRYAAREARRALALGRHVMVFSDNVPIDEEVALKKEALERGLLLMGPDCGTAIINGKPLGFANAVRRGPIGVVGASGTGIQELTSCIHRLGGGISQAIGTGGRDLSERVGGRMTLFGIEALASDAATRVLVIVSKPPSASVAERVLSALARISKPSVVCFLGAPPGRTSAAPTVVFADSCAEAAETACRLAGVPPRQDLRAGADEAAVASLAARLQQGRALRGLFCGGSTGHEALAILSRAGLQVRSNLYGHGPLRIDGLEPAGGHVLLDLGDDLFTRGRPHPMLEPSLRNERLALEAADPEVGLLLFDLILGYGSHADPAGVLVDGVQEAQAHARGRGQTLVAVASITGTPADPQDFDAQARRLEAGGIIVASDNRRAAELAAAVLRRVS